MGEIPEVTDEILLLCGYVKVHQVLACAGQGVAFSLINGWERLTVTTRAAGGEGSALGEIREITVWAAPGESKTEKPWRYDLNVRVETNGSLLVAVIRSDASVGHSSMVSGSGTLVELNPPSPMEMLAAQARALSID